MTLEAAEGCAVLHLLPYPLQHPSPAVGIAFGVCKEQPNQKSMKPMQVCRSTAGRVILRCPPKELHRIHQNIGGRVKEDARPHFPAITADSQGRALPALPSSLHWVIVGDAAGPSIERCSLSELPRPISASAFGPAGAHPFAGTNETACFYDFEMMYVLLASS